MKRLVRRPGPGGGLELPRRDFLRGATALIGVGGVGVATTACSSAAEPPAAPVFVHGVASGDPLPDAVILWTRVTTSDGTAAEVAWEVATDPGMTNVVLTGAARAEPERDFTVKVDAKPLQPGATYYYRFRALGRTSRVGRTRTAWVGPVERVRIGMVSCASYAHGYFHAYRELAKRTDLDLVLHLGDYIYEYGSGQYGDVRAYEPEHEILSLADYRTRHALYKRDANLQEAHRQHVWVTVWDDHETANDAYKDGAENHEPSEGDFQARKAAARRAYFEWMPIRETPDGRIFRRVPIGDLADLVLLDTRLWARTKQTGGFLGTAPAPDPTRTLLGDDQAAWLEEQLAGARGRWKLLGQQVMVSNLQLDATSLVNLDQWQGYPESRARLLGYLRDQKVEDLVVLTGDIHSSWANEVVGDPRDPAQYDPATGRGALAVEIVTPGVTSPGIPPQFLRVVDEARPFNPHVRWVDPVKRGYVVLDVTRDRVQGAWHHFEDITVEDPATASAFAAAWSVARGATRLVADASPAPAREGGPPAAPA